MNDQLPLFIGKKEELISYAYNYMKVRLMPILNLQYDKLYEFKKTLNLECKELITDEMFFVTQRAYVILKPDILLKFQTRECDIFEELELPEYSGSKTLLPILILIHNLMDSRVEKLKKLYCNYLINKVS